jgi:hypothetical protein
MDLTGKFTPGRIIWSSGYAWDKVSSDLRSAKPSSEMLARDDFDIEQLPSFKRDVGLLVGMAFDRDLARWALRNQAGDINAAAELASSSGAAQRYAEHVINEKREEQDAKEAEEYDSARRMTFTMASGAAVAAVAAGAAVVPVAACAAAAATVTATAYWVSGSAESEDVNAEEGGSSSSTSPVVEASEDVHVPEAVLEREDSFEVLSHWVGSRRTVAAALPAYEQAAQQVCVPYQMMCSSRLGGRCQFLEELLLSQLGILPSIQIIVLAMVRKAFDLGTDAQAFEHNAAVPGLAEGNMFEGAVYFHSELKWERPFLEKALVLLCETEDPMGLQVVLGMLRTGADWCKARKTLMFSSIIERLKIPERFSTRDQQCMGTSSAAESSRKAVWDVITQLVDDTKDQAFKTTFLEPTKMCFRRHEEFAREDQVEVHGANTYLAVLASTLGVQLNRRPHMRDFVVGCTDFLSFEEDPPAWKEEHFGFDWESRRELREAVVSRQKEPDGEPTKVGFFELIGLVSSIFGFSGFVFSGASVQDVANAAVDPQGDKEQQLHMAKYLERFTYWFSEEFLVPRMITRLTGDGGCLEAVQAIMDDLVSQYPSLRSQEDGEDDVRFWLWDMSQVPASLRRDRAQRLLRHAEVLKPLGDFFPESAPLAELSTGLAAGGYGSASQQWRRCITLGV